MAVITLTTDLGLKDYYVASIKGAIISQLPSFPVVDISHEIPPFDISVAAFCLKNCYKDFPSGSIHIIGVSPEADEFTRHLIVFEDGHYFIGADNGVFSLLFPHLPKNVYELNILALEDKRTFPTKDVFVQAACHIGRGGTLEVIGKKTEGVKEKRNLQPTTEENAIKGIVIYTDKYGNVTTNITRQLFQMYGKGRPFEITYRRSDYNIKELHHNYNEVPEGEKVALFSHNDFLEIAINKGNASKLFGLKLYDTIRIEFKTTENANTNSPTMF